MDNLTPRERMRALRLKESGADERHAAATVASLTRSLAIVTGGQFMRAACWSCHERA